MKPFSLNIAQAALAASLFLCCAEVPEELANDPGNEACSGGAYYNSPGCPGYAGGAAPGELLCSAAPEAGAEGEALRKPTVTCGGIAVSASSWAGSPHAPDWDSPKEGSYSGIVAIAACGGSSKMADCPGLLTVVPAKLACGSVPSTAIEGMPVTKPAVLCDGIAVPAESWQPASLSWSSPEEGVYSNIKATAKCGGISKTVACSGTLAVVPPGGVLTCDAVPSAGAAGVSITPPAVKCDGAAVSSGITWEGAPNWGNPSANSYGSVKAKAGCGGSSKTASCSGTLAVVPAALTCAAVPSAGFAGVAIAPPAVKCDGIAVSSGITWEGAPNWGNPSAGSYSGVKATATCGGISRTASCGGSLTVTAACGEDYSSANNQCVLKPGYGECFNNNNIVVGVYRKADQICKGYGSASAVIVNCADDGGSPLFHPDANNNYCVLPPEYGACHGLNGIVDVYYKQGQICKNYGSASAHLEVCGQGYIPDTNNRECVLDPDYGECFSNYGIVGVYNKAIHICKDKGTPSAVIVNCADENGGFGMVPNIDNTQCILPSTPNPPTPPGNPPTPPAP